MNAMIRKDKSSSVPATENRPLLSLSLGGKLLTLFTALFVMLTCVGLIRGLVNEDFAASRNGILLFSVFQDILMFMFPAWLTACLVSHRPMSYLGLTREVSGRQFAGVVILLIIIAPLFNVIVDWNASMHFPVGWQAFESTMRRWEDSAAATTELLLSDTSVWGLVSGILVVGLLTGLAEETFFRAGLQKAMDVSGVNRHLAVWLSAFVFSAMHLQFFGFVPRLILGALFGYIYLSTGSLWVAASAHALNNSWVVIAGWLYARGYIAIDLSQSDAFPESVGLIAFSGFLTLLFIVKLWKPLFSRINMKSDPILFKTDSNGKE